MSLLLVEWIGRANAHEHNHLVKKRALSQVPLERAPVKPLPRWQCLPE